MEAMRPISPFMKWDRTCNAVPLSIVREVVPFRTRMEVVNFHFRQAGEHRFSYDFETLSRLLEECGFESVVEMPFRKSELPEFGDRRRGASGREPSGRGDRPPPR